MNRPAFGAVLAGGASSRYGAPKALAEVGGARIVDRVAGALDRVGADVIVIANDAPLAAEIGRPWRADVRPGIGALGGIHSALHWAAEEGRPGVLALACDMPFVPDALLRALLDAGLNGPDVVVPESGGRRGIEPLCAYYGARCIQAIERAIDAGDRRMIGFHHDVRVSILPRGDIVRFGDPDVIFLNVNTPDQRTRAEQIAAEGGR